MEVKQEIKKALIGLMPFSNDAEYTFTPDVYTTLPEQYQPSITVRSLTNAEKAKITKLAKDGDLQNDVDSIVFACVKKWENVYLLPDLSDYEYSEDLSLYKELPRPLKGAIEDTVVKLSGLSMVPSLGLR